MQAAWQTGDPIAFQIWTNCNTEKTSLHSFNSRLKPGLMQPQCKHCYNETHHTIDIRDQRNCLARCKGPYWDNSSLNVQFLLQSSQIRVETMCSVLLLANLAQPQWVKVHCKLKLFVDVFCGVGTDSGPNETEIDNNDKHLLHRKSCVLVDQTCFLFEWMKRERVKSGLKRKHQNATNFEKLFDATGEEFPPIFSGDFQSVIIYKRFYNVYRFESRSSTGSTEGLVIVSSPPMRRQIGDNVLKCRSGTYLSVLSVCDEIPDCLPDSLSREEINCDCSENNSDKKACKNVMGISGKRKCSLFFMLYREQCVLYQEFASKYQQFKTNETKQLQTFSHENIDARHICDHLHCKSDPNTERDSTKVFFEMKKNHCQQKGEISCRGKHGTCFNVSSVCSYILDSFGKLTPCRNGQHLQSCQQFECSVMFKCPGFYCIPWAYTCDGKQDCPAGYDESITINDCGLRRDC